MATLLIVEDDPHIASGLRFNLEAEGHSVLILDSGEAALATMSAAPQSADCIVLDVMLPGLDGFAVATELRRRGCVTPILMLTARGRAEDVLRGFAAGADDYLPKPFDLSILTARINALVRRHGWLEAVKRAGSDDDAQKPATNRYTFAGKAVDFDRQELDARGQTHHLTLMETQLLRYLIDREGQIVSRRSMLEDVWNVREDTDTRAIDHFIGRLRKYVEDDPSRPRHVLTARSVGYRFVAAPPAKRP